MCRLRTATEVSCFTRVTVDLNALAWLEDYLQTWQGTLLVVYVVNLVIQSMSLNNPATRSHDRAFLWVCIIRHWFSQITTVCIQGCRSDGHHPSTFRSPGLLQGVSPVFLIIYCIHVLRRPATSLTFCSYLDIGHETKMDIILGPLIF